MKKLVMIFSFLILINHAFANSMRDEVTKEINNWYSNYTRPSTSFKNQAVGYYGSLGGIQERHPIVGAISPITMTPPSISAGCGGVDFFMGGFKLASGDEYIKLLSAIGKNSASLAFMLAIKTVSPMIEGTINQIQDTVNKINKYSKDSCEAATALMGGALKGIEGDNSDCVIEKVKGGLSYVEAETTCRAQNGASTTKNTVTFVEGNIAWDIISKDNALSSNKSLAQYVMNLSGTVIKKKGGIATVPIKNTEQKINDLVSVVVLGGTEKIFACKGSDLEKCLDLEERDEDFKDGFENTINKLIDSILAKIKKGGNEQLTPEESGLMSNSTIPIYKFLISFAAANPYATSGDDLKKYSRTLATNILVNEMMSIITQMNKILGQDPNLIGSDSHKAFETNFYTSIASLERLKEKTENETKKMADAIQQINQYERTILSKLNEKFVNNYMWVNQ